jgi:hypothetical protein
MKGFQHFEGFSHLEWAVVGEHDSAATNTNFMGCVSDVVYHQFRAGAGVTGCVVVFGHPVTMVARQVALLCQFDGIVQARRFWSFVVHRRLV